jgi:glycerol-3-phosphate acyltransferase PlsY
VRWLLAFAGGYLCGSVPVVDLVVRRTGLDIRSVGDRNPGYWNVREQLGSRAALPVLLGDTAKGMAGGLIGVLLARSGPWGVAWVGVLGAMVGHAWPLFAGLRGGKSLLAFTGGMLVVTPVPALIAVVVVVVAAALGHFALGVRLGLVAFPVLQALLLPRAQVAATGALMCFFVVRFGTDALARRRAARPHRAGTPDTPAPG